MQIDRRTRGIPVILCPTSAQQLTELSAHLTDLGVHVVVKPFDVVYLLETIDKARVAVCNPPPGLDAVREPSSRYEHEVQPQDWSPRTSRSQP